MENIIMNYEAYGNCLLYTNDYCKWKEVMCVHESEC